MERIIVVCKKYLIIFSVRRTQRILSAVDGEVYAEFVGSRFCDFHEFAAVYHNRKFAFFSDDFRFAILRYPSSEIFFGYVNDRGFAEGNVVSVDLIEVEGVRLCVEYEECVFVAEIELILTVFSVIFCI